MDTDTAPRRRWLSPLLFALPGIALAAVGITHPHHLTAETASYWWRMHVALTPIFPLLGLALAGLVGRRKDGTAWAVRVLAYVYAVGYTSLDLLSGVATGYSVDPAVSVGTGPAPAALPRLYDIGIELGTWGARAFLVAAVAIGVDAALKVGVRSLPPSVLLVVASVSFLDSHIYRWRGVITVLVIGLSIGWLRWLQDRPATAALAPRDG